MCGIAGHLGVPADDSLLERLTAQHPGSVPTETFHADDGPGGDGAGLAARPGGSRVLLPHLLRSRGGRFTLALDGELYNRSELRADLETLGHEFRTGGDAEIVLAAFTEWGSDGFDRIEGAFAVAVWDRDAKTLTLARDPFGIRPLYVCRVDASPEATGGVQVAGGAEGAAASGTGEAAYGWLVASEIRGLLASGLYEKRPNDRVIYRYLCYRIHDDGRETFFEGIERVGAGEVVTLTAGGIERRQFSRLRDELATGAHRPRPYSPSVAEEFRDRLTEAVRRRTGTTGRVATALSGGLDSAAIAVLADRVEHARARDHGGATGQDSWSAIYPGSVNDEQEHIDAVLATLDDRVEPHFVEPTATEFKNDLHDLVRTQEEPIVSTGAYTQYRLLRDAAQVDGVVLYGQGGDEALAGFGPHYLVHLRELRSRSAVQAATELGRSLDVLYRRGRPVVGARLRGRKDVPVTSLLAAPFAARHAGEHYATERTDLRARLLADLFDGSLPARLRYTDKNARRFGVPVRMPFVDRDLVRFVFGLESEALVKDGRGKRVLRDAMRGLLPDSVLDRRDKVGAATPQGEWFMRLKNHIYGEFLSESFANRPYFDQSAVLEAFEGWIKGTNSVGSMTIWRILNVELWLQEFFDERVDADAAPPHVKTDFEPNARKQLDLTMSDGTQVRRYPLRTELYAREDDLVAKTLGYVERFFRGLPDAAPQHRGATTGRWYFFISEKIVAITQGRSFFIWDIKVGRPARILSRYVTRTPAGIGLGSPFTMQLAIEEAGLPRVLYASAGGAIGKLLGKRGLFYELVGGDIRAIDGPTEYSVYPANVSAKLGPKDPDAVAARLSAAIRERVPAAYRDTFGGTVVMDANDIGRNVLGKDAPGPKERYEAMFADNPLGQGSEQTPMAVVFEEPSA
jgi:asparagine synthase (glutamine-hydrolysing)